MINTREGLRTAPGRERALRQCWPWSLLWLHLRATELRVRTAHVCRGQSIRIRLLLPENNAGACARLSPERVCGVPACLPADDVPFVTLAECFLPVSTGPPLRYLLQHFLKVRKIWPQSPAQVCPT